MISYDSGGIVIMQVVQQLWQKYSGWKNTNGNKVDKADLVLYFGGKGTLDSGERFDELKSLYPDAELVGCSTGGEIANDEVLDNSVVAVALSFNKTEIKTASASVESNNDSFEAGHKIAKELKQKGLKNVFVLSDGTNVNGSDLVRGMYDVFDSNVIVTGGLAGDAADFEKTLVGLNNKPAPKQIVAVGFYGENISIGYGSIGGWDVFGPERKITRSEGNILYELDGKPALDLYKEYLGEDEIKELPGSALLFPLSIYPADNPENTIVRTVVGIDEKAKSMIFAGDVPEGYIAQLMHGNFDNLVDGAAKAAESALSGNKNSALALLVSCIGRKLLLGQRISDETEAISEVFNNNIPTIGFYSYGEICHQQFTRECMLHNQTMTVTVINESQ